MHLSKALELKAGDLVKCPEDNFNKPFVGTVKYMPTKPSIEVSHQGIRYVWVLVENQGKSSIWPSNKLEIVCATNKRK